MKCVFGAQHVTLLIRNQSYQELIGNYVFHRLQRHTNSNGGSFDTALSFKQRDHNSSFLFDNIYLNDLDFHHTNNLPETTDWLIQIEHRNNENIEPAMVAGEFNDKLVSR